MFPAERSFASFLNEFMTTPYILFGGVKWVGGGFFGSCGGGSGFYIESSVRDTDHIHCM